MYAKGLGTEKSLRKAAIWYYKAAKKNSPKAQYKLGTLYENGIGVPKDQERAKAWYEISAKKGYKKSKAALKRLETKK
ncbi:MAG: sel1 repeat family protein [Rhodospirillaceae bacterium]|jgi:TPR repeat protein|nr:sel1 repeat family protein [Rhodospirillales bacterium]MBT3907272.1 sel1 repeat family protein [Rhodospirillaceae bacterium]MBT4703100.1 sel1 repeat family protein [Rhodospirillaceae bacterium]MBT5034931.1 sel1 repeat family protein [Rhodospirillaceae bacterium]MBT6220325.1 sel1 repeat family protein [Rhodospirillaceae bacterium]